MKSKIFLIALLLILFLADNYVYASFADYTDEDAEKNTQSMIQNYQDNFDSSKSDNNYLKELIVQGGTLFPNFDKQVLNYSVKIDEDNHEINISANPENNKVTVNGIGKIDISNISECRIEVIAESGTTRTYILKLIKEKNNDNNSLNTQIIDQSSIEDPIDTIEEKRLDSDIQQNTINNKNKKNDLISIGICLLLVVLVILLIIFKRKSAKSKH